MQDQFVQVTREAPYAVRFQSAGSVVWYPRGPNVAPLCTQPINPNSRPTDVHTSWYFGVPGLEWRPGDRQPSLRFWWLSSVRAPQSCVSSEATAASLHALSHPQAVSSARFSPHGTQGSTYNYHNSITRLLPTGTFKAQWQLYVPPAV